MCYNILSPFYFLSVFPSRDNNYCVVPTHIIIIVTGSYLQQLVAHRPDVVTSDPDLGCRSN